MAVNRNLVLFVHPCLQANLEFKVRAKRENLGIGYLISSLRRNGYSAEVIDADILDIPLPQLVRDICQLQPDILCISVSSQMSIVEVFKLLQMLREENPSIHIVLGGQFPSLEHSRLIRESDSINTIVRGEAETRISEIVGKIIEGKPLFGIPGVTYRKGKEMVDTGGTYLIKDLDSLPNPARDTLPSILRIGQPVSILASRGCYGSCTFCTPAAFYGRSGWRPRSPTLVIDEIAYLVDSYGASHFRFYDDTFVGPGARGYAHVASLCRGLLQRGIRITFEIYCRANDVEESLFELMREAGCIAVTCGIESGSNEALKRFRKGTNQSLNRHAISALQRLDIVLKSAFIMFEPHSTLEDIEANCSLLRLLAENNPANLLFFSDEEALPYSGTQLRRDLVAERRLEMGNWWDIGHYHFSDPRVEALFNLVTSLKPQIQLLQRFWVQFTLDMKRSFVPADVHGKVDDLCSRIQRVPFDNLELFISCLRKERKDTVDIVECAQSAALELIRECRSLSDLPSDPRVQQYS